MKGYVEESRTWRERLLSWPWRPWVAWKPAGIAGDVTWNGEAFVIASLPAGHRIHLPLAPPPAGEAEP